MVYIVIPNEKEVTICLNGHSITALGNTVFEVRDKAKLIIENCNSDTGGINYTKGKDGEAAAISGNHPSEPSANDGGSLELNNIEIVLGDEDCVGIINRFNLTMRDCSIKTANNAKIRHAIQNEPTGNAYLINTTICDLYTKGGAILNSGDIGVGGNTKIINNNGPVNKEALEIPGNYRGNNIINCYCDIFSCEGIVNILSDDDAPVINEMKIGIAKFEYDGNDGRNNKNIGGPFCFNTDSNLLKCFSSDLDEYVINFDLENDHCLELIPKPQEEKKEPELKDETCEAVIGPNWTWDEELGVCKEVVRNKVGYKIVNTATY